MALNPAFGDHTMITTPNTGRLRARTSFRSQASLTPREREEMYDLFQQYYANTKREVFAADLARKHSVILFTEQAARGGRVVGFSTMARSALQLENGRRVLALFSGDTVLHKQYWGSRILQLAFFREIVAQKLRSPFTPVYWMLISKGYKTFAMMRRNFARSYPSPHGAKPAEIEALLQAYYGGKYGAAYHPSSDLILLHEDLAPVKGELAKPSADAMRDPEVAYFMQKNPGYAQGDELACTAEIRFRDFPCIVYKYILPLFRLPKLRNARPAPHARQEAGLQLEVGG